MSTNRQPPAVTWQRRHWQRRFRLALVRAVADRLLPSCVDLYRLLKAAHFILVPFVFENIPVNLFTLWNSLRITVLAITGQLKLFPLLLLKFSPAA